MVDYIELLKQDLVLSVLIPRNRNTELCCNFFLAVPDSLPRFFEGERKLTEIIIFIVIF